MKLKHGDKFAKKSGSIWRLLFVFALFPWLRQYRILNEDELLNPDDATNADNVDQAGSTNALQAKIALLNQKIQRLTEMNKNLKKD